MGNCCDHESALHAAEAELGELRRRVGSLIERLRPDIECAPWVITELKLLASDGGADGDNEGEGK